MVGEGSAKPDSVGWVYCEEEIAFQSGIFDAATQVEGKSGKFIADIVLIIGVGKGGVGKETRAKDMVPAGSAGGVTPVEIEVEEIAVKTKDIASEVTADVEMVFGAEVIVYFSI